MKYDDEDGDEDDNCVDDDDCDEDDDGNDNDFYDYHDDKDARRSNPWPMIKMISEMIKKKMRPEDKGTLWSPVCRVLWRGLSENVNK